MKHLWLFDLDGTIYDNAHRQHYVLRDEPDWDGFHAYDEIMKDTIRAWAVGLFEFGTFKYGKHGFMTARDERCSLATIDVLYRDGLLDTHTPLYMNKAHCASGVHFKAERLLELLRKDQNLKITFVEDQDNIIDALRGLAHKRMTVLDAKNPNLRQYIESTP